VLGGHVARGCIVRTTAEIVLALLPEHCFSREHDVRSGFAELVIRADSGSGSIDASNAGARSASLDVAADGCAPSNVRR
jgi:hypothetical protein